MFSEGPQVYLAAGSTDLRKSINGLTALAQESLQDNVFSGSLFVFCNRRRSLLKLVYWDGNGFCLWMKQLEEDRFHWPEAGATGIQVSMQQLRWLLDGLDFQQNQAHPKRLYSSLR